MPAPTVADFRDSVRRIAKTDFDAVWGKTCATAGVSAHGELTLDQLTKLATVLKTAPGALRVVGQSLSVRLSSYKTLSMLAGAAR